MHGRRRRMEVELEYPLFLYNSIHPIFCQDIFSQCTNPLPIIQYFSPNILTGYISLLSKLTGMELEYSLFLYYRRYCPPNIFPENIPFVSWNIFFLYRSYHSSNILLGNMLQNARNTSSVIWN